MSDALRILLVEDTVSDAELVREHLAAAEPGAVEITCARSLVDGVAVLRAGGPFDCVLLDLTLPDAVGLEALAELTYAAPATPVVVLTGVDAQEMAHRAVDQGAQDYLVKGQAPGPVLLRSLRHAVQRGRSARRLERLAPTDAVTGLPSRVVLHDRLAVALARTGASHRGVGLLVVELDDFARVGEPGGPEGGDRVLRTVGERLRGALRPSDVVTRWGPAAFVVLCDEVSEPEAFSAVVRRLEGALDAPVEVGARSVRVQASIGAALALGDEDTPDRLLADAGAALTAAKRARAGGGVASASAALVAAASGTALDPAAASPVVLAPGHTPVPHPPVAPSQIRIFLCDDVADLRLLMRTYLEDDEDFAVVGEAGDGSELAQAVDAVAADVILLDLSMPDVDGLEATVALRAALPDLGIVVLSGFEQERMEAQALALGADRYLEKRAGMGEVRRAIREVAAARRGTRALLGEAA